MYLPPTEYYIMIAISGATLGVFASNAKDFGINMLILFIPTLSVFASWFLVIMPFIGKNNLKEVDPVEFWLHFGSLFLFLLSVSIMSRAAGAVGEKAGKKKKEKERW